MRTAWVRRLGCGDLDLGSLFGGEVSEVSALFDQVIARLRSAFSLDKKLVHVPGTSLFSEDPNAAAAAQFEGIDTHLVRPPFVPALAELADPICATQLKHGTGKNAGIILVPQPSANDPNDPLRCPSFSRVSPVCELTISRRAYLAQAPLLWCPSVRYGAGWSCRAPRGGGPDCHRWRVQRVARRLRQGTLLLSLSDGEMIPDAVDRRCSRHGSSSPSASRPCSSRLAPSSSASVLFVLQSQPSLHTLIFELQIYLFSSVLLLVSTVWASFSTSLGSFTGSRILMGVAAAPLEFLVGSSINDVYFVHERGRPVSLWNLALSEWRFLASPPPG